VGKNGRKNWYRALKIRRHNLLVAQGSHWICPGRFECRDERGNQRDEK